MLRRHSTKSKSDLHRRKSTTSVRSVPLEHINVAVAQRDAQLAAMEAFSRGQDRLSAEMARFPAQPASAPKENSNVARLAPNNTTVSQNNSDQDDHGLSRRQSVRFVGPDSGLKSRASRITMRTAAPECPDIPPRRSIYGSQSWQNVAHTPQSVLGNTQSLQLPDRDSSVGKTLVAHEFGLSQACVQSLAPELEHYTPEDDVASMPSSYRRLRKSRSMYSAKTSMRARADGGTDTTLEPAVTDHAHSNPTPSFSRYSFLHRKENSQRSENSALRAAKSMSFLRHRRERLGTSESARASMCESSLVLDNRETSLRPRLLLTKPSRLFGSKGRGKVTDTPKDSRSNSPNGILPNSATGTSLTLSLNRYGSIKSKARKVSSSLKSRFRNLFINKSEDDAKFPAQQIEAQKTHVSGIFDENPWESAIVEINHGRERSSLSRVSTHLPSLHAVPSSERLRSRRGSIESFGGESRSVSGDKSRVTSWASSEVNTIIAHHTHDSLEEWEKQRLSIINEHTSHAHSSSIGLQQPLLQTITSQEELTPSTDLARLPPGATVDSQRVYSALMKRMSETKQLAGIVEQQRKSSDASDPFRTLSPPSTIGSAGSSGTAALAHAKTPQVLSWATGKEDDGYEHPSRSTSTATEGSYKAVSIPVAGEHRRLSPPIQLTPTHAPAARSITDRSSVFFGTPTSHLFRTKSPYRRSLQDAMNSEREREEACFDTTETMAPTPTRSVAGKVAYSESNYSEGTQIHNTRSRKELLVAGYPNTLNAHGDASILTDMPTYQPTGQRHISTASSIEWKACLSADVEKKEKSPGSPTKVSGRVSEVEYAMPTMPKSFGCGHVREAAQIGSCDEDEHYSSPTVHMPTSPTTPLGAIDSNIVKLSPRQRSILRTTPPPSRILQENEQPTSYETMTSASPGEEDKILPTDALKPKASPLNSERTWGGLDPVTRPQTPVHGPEVRLTKSLARLQNFSRIREPQTGSPQPPASSTIRLMRKAASKLEPSSASATASPAFSSAFERHFGSVSRNLGGELAEKENQSPRGGQGQDQGSDTKGQFRGSKTMVELFLGTRRRQGASGSGDGAAFL